MFVLRQNSIHRGNPEYEAAVEQWQNFLRGEDYDIVADGDFGPGTHKATVAFQEDHGLRADGEVGNRTYGEAMKLGFTPVEDDDEPGTIPERSAHFPPPPQNLFAPDNAKRAAFYGEIQFSHTPRAGNREAIRITNDWAKKHIVKVEISQLVGVDSAPADGEVYFHKKVVAPAKDLFAAWESEGLMDLVLSWAGSYVPRLVRGSTRTLSNHAFGSAFDINVPWNGLGKQPALVGRKGSVRLLVPLANQHGFYWGGHYRNRKDGMHFEYARID